MKKILAMSLMILLTFGLLAGCGQQAAGGQNQAGQTPAGDAGKEAEFKVEKLVVGLDDTFAPMGFRDDAGNIVGFDIDLAKEVGVRLGAEVVFQPIDWDSKEMELESGNIDCIWNGMTITEERKANMEMSDPYIANNQLIMVDPASGIKSKADLAGKEIGVQKGSSALDAVNSDELKDMVSKISEYPANVDAFNDLKIGRLSAVVADEIMARYYLGTDAYKGLTLLEESLAAEEYGIGFKKGNTQLRDAVQAALDEMVADGKAGEISTKWFGEDIMIRK
jgi:polar amino acid transport system substrate-binding protein